MDAKLKNLFTGIIDKRELLLYEILTDQLAKDIKTTRIPDLYNSPERISIITSTNKPFYLDNILANYHRQRYQNKELIIILNSDTLDLQAWKNAAKKYNHVQVYQLNQSNSLGKCLNYAVEKSSGDYIAKFDDDDYYGSNYLINQVYCFFFTKAAIIGKGGQFVYFQSSKDLAYYNFMFGGSYNYVDDVAGGTHLAKRSVFNKVKFRDCSVGEDIFFNQDCRKAGFSLYAGDPFNYLRIRVPNKNYHSWKLNDQELLNTCTRVKKTDDPVSLITL